MDENPYKAPQAKLAVEEKPQEAIYGKPPQRTRWPLMLWLLLLGLLLVYMIRLTWVPTRASSDIDDSEHEYRALKAAGTRWVKGR